jgi:hypothetical protein
MPTADGVSDRHARALRSAWSDAALAGARAALTTRYSAILDQSPPGGAARGALRRRAAGFARPLVAVLFHNGAPSALTYSARRP